MVRVICARLERAFERQGLLLRDLEISVPMVDWPDRLTALASTPRATLTRDHGVFASIHRLG